MFIRFSAPIRSGRRLSRSCCAAVSSAKSASVSPSGPMERSEMAFAAFGDVAERLRRSTVPIHSGSSGSRGAGGSGSGVILSSTGLIVTNANVVPGYQARVQFCDGRECEAQVTDRDHSCDLAALRVMAEDLPSVSIADSSRVRVGELALAIGNPLGFVGALSTGVVHGVGPVRGLGPSTWIQANLRLAPGNSGGPLATASLLPGDILLGPDEQAFASFEDLRLLLEGSGTRQVRLEFLRGNYARIRKVTLLLGGVRRPAQAQAA